MTPQQIKDKFRREGRSVSDWAREHGYDRTEVYRLLNGQLRGNYGRAHEIAVALGIKPGVKRVAEAAKKAA